MTELDEMDTDFGTKDSWRYMKGTWDGSFKGVGMAGGAFVIYVADEIDDGEPDWLEVVRWKGRFPTAKSALDAEAWAFVALVVVLWNHFHHGNVWLNCELANTVASDANFAGFP